MLCKTSVNTETCWNLYSDFTVLCLDSWTHVQHLGLLRPNENSCFFNFRDLVSSINELLNQMCGDGFSEEVRICSSSRTGVSQPAQTPDWLAGPNSRLITCCSTLAWADGKMILSPQNPRIFSRHVNRATTSAKTRRGDHTELSQEQGWAVRRFRSEL